MSWQGRGKAAIVGVGFSPIERHAAQPLGMFADRAIADALEDCGLPAAEIDGLATYPSAPYAGARQREGEDVIGCEYVISNLCPGDVRWYADLNGGMVTAAIAEAAIALISGACRYALVWRAMHHPAGRYGVSRDTSATAMRQADDDSQFSAPWGCTGPVMWHALALRRYIERYHPTREQMATLPLNSRRHAQLNDHAFFRGKPMELNDYLSARMIAEPLSLLDCDVPVQACVAFVMTTAERAKDLKQKPAYLAGFATNASRRPPLLHSALVDHYAAGTETASQLWKATRMSACEMSAAMLYDGFAPSAMYWLECAGFCGPGEAYAFAQDGRIALGGALPVNTFGGSLSQGRLHGMGHAAEAVLQVTGRAGARQVPDANAVCVFAGSPMMRGSGIIITRDP